MSASTMLPSAESVVGPGAPQVVPAPQAVVTAGKATGLPYIDILLLIHRITIYHALAGNCDWGLMAP